MQAARKTGCAQIAEKSDRRPGELDYPSRFRAATSRYKRLASACVAAGGILEEAETSAEAVGPLEIVHQAPMEIAAHRHTLGRRALQLCQIAAQEHDAIGVVDEAFGGWHVGRRAAVLSDVDVACVPSYAAPSRAPRDRSPTKSTGVPIGFMSPRRRCLGRPH